MRVRRYNEGHGGARVTLVFQDADDALLAPATARYRIDCLTTGRMVRDWTVLSPASIIYVPITSSDNAIINQSNASERKQMCIQSEYGTDNQVVEYNEWTVKNLLGIT